MLFSLRWLLETCPVDATPAQVADALTDRGLTVDAVEASGDDHALDVDVPANRPDCLGHLGLARELAAALAPGRHPSLFEVPYAVATPNSGPPGGDPVDRTIELSVASHELCPRYTARVVRGVGVGPSPPEVAARLETCGLRSVNNVVDASNLVLLALGQPIHFFDLARLAPAGGGSRPSIAVRLPHDGEGSMTTLDGEARELTADTLLIADGSGPIALAGVMGGRETEIGDTTRDVLIEAASFAPASIRRTSRRLNLQTDASFRFARGVDPAGVPAAQALAVELLATLAGGTAGPGMLDAWSGAVAPATLELRASEVERLLGFRPADDELAASLDAMGLSPKAARGRSTIRVPSYRVDLEREADLVEEVARHVGYERIPTRTPDGSEGGRPPAREIEERARDLLAGGGFHEAFAYAMIAPGEDDPFVPDDAAAALPLDNPIAETMAVLRRSVLPGLLRAAALNQRRGIRDVRLFEIGHVFVDRDGQALPHEPRRLGVAWSGAGEPRHWSRPARDADIYDLIGLVERTIGALAPSLELRRDADAAEGAVAFHPGRSARWLDPLDGRLVARAGELHPGLDSDLEHPLAMAEIELDPLVDAARAVAAHRGVSRLPSASRDLSIVMPVSLAYGEILRVLHGLEAPAPVEFEVIDRYVGPPLPDDRVSLTVRLTLAPVDRTLVDEETDGFRLRLIDALRRELAVEIRG